ncbi:MAG TPA: PAS domain-containing protein, partial [Candidatus Ozemobacteraceae bacterium]|nr:PAS domain-containing protein [Candidatus Ozemobacteraceae bacterium]
MARGPDADKSREELLAELAELRQQLTACRPESPVPAEPLALENSPPFQNWQAVIDAVGSTIWVLDAACRIHMTNRSTHDVVPGANESPLGRRCWQVMHGTEEPIATCPIRRARQTKQRESAVIQVGRRWLEVTVDPLLSPTREITGFVHLTTDVTARVQNEELRRTSERRVRALLDAISESAFLMDVEGRVLETNDVMLKRLQIDRDQLAKTNVYDLLPPAVAEQRRKYAQQVIETASPVHFEDERFGRTILNSIYPVTGSDGRVDALAIYGMDVTSERQTRREIEANRKRTAELNSLLQLVLDTIPVRIFWKDRNSAYLGCNQLFARDAGRTSPEEMIGKTDAEMGWHEQAALYVTDDQKVITSGTPKINFEECQTTPDGRRIWLRTTKVPLRDETGTVFGVLGTYEDITERKQIETSLRESEKRYRSLFQCHHSVQLVIDPATGQIVDANPAACRFYGYD